MNQTSDQFLEWALDPSRSLEERYGIVRLIEDVYQRSYRGPDRDAFNWQLIQQTREARKFNPAYDPQPDPKKLRIVAELLPQVEALHLDNHGDERPLRDLAFLAFLPQLRLLKLRGIEMERLDDLRHLTSLHLFEIHSDEVEDYTALALCLQLREIKICTCHPWPLLTGLETLPYLEDLHWSGNGRTLSGIPSLPALKMLRIGSVHYKADLQNSLRDFHQLPEMPLLEYLWGGWFYRLEGIARYPRLRFANIWGFFKDLEALRGLSSLGHLRVNSPRLEEVAVVASMPSVKHFAVLSERPQEWSDLMESETLREVYHVGLLPCYNLDQPDLETLRMLIPSWNDWFGLPEPRALPPMRLWVAESEGSAGGPSAAFGDGPEGWDGDLGMRQSEAWWAGQLVHGALREAGLLKLQGVRFEAKPPNVFDLFSSEPRPSATRQLGINIMKAEAIGRLGEIFECLRRALSRIRYPWQFYVTVQPEPDADLWDESWREELKKTYAEEMEELERENEHQRKRAQTHFRDEQRFRLLQELGQDTAQFRPSPLPQRSGEESSDDPPANDEEAKDGNDEGGIANFDPDKASQDESWLPEVEIGDPNRDWNALFCIFLLTERGIHMRANNRGLNAIADLLDLVPEPDPGGLTEGD